MQRNAIRRDVGNCNAMQCNSNAIECSAMQRGAICNKNKIQPPTPMPMLVLVTMKVPFRGDKCMNVLLNCMLKISVDC